MKRIFSAAVLIAAATFAGSADAATILLNIHRGSGTVITGAYGSGVGQALAPVSFTGSTWNNLQGSATTGALADMKDTDGNDTTVDITVAGNSSNGGGSSLGTEAGMQMLNNFAKGAEGSLDTQTWTLDGLTIGQAYVMHVVANGNNPGDGAKVTMTSGAAVPVASATTTPAAKKGDATSFNLGDNYVTQSWTANATTAVFTMTEPTEGLGYVNVNGFQLIAVPEPGSLALLGLGGLCVLRRRRG